MGRLAIAPALLAATACGTLGGDGGGAANLPNRGIIPYVKVGLGDPPLPFVLRPPAGQRYLHPSAILTGDRVALYFEILAANGRSRAIARAEADPSGLQLGAPELVLTASQAPSWAAGRVGAPSVILAGATFHLVFEAGQSEAIGHATSTDGRSFAVDPAPLLTRDDQAAIGAPALLEVDGGFTLLYQAQTATTAPRIARATSGADLHMVRMGDVLRAGTSCAAPDGTPAACWDGMGVGSPELRRSTTATGRTLFRLMFTGIGGAGDASAPRNIGFAASDDGITFNRYASNPLMDEKNVSEESATNLRAGDRYLLYYVDTRGDGQGIGLAIDAAGAPSERF